MREQLETLHDIIDTKTAQLARNIQRLGELRTTNPSTIRELEKHIQAQQVELTNLNREYLVARRENCK